VNESLRNKKVLLMGLGILQGGVNTARWLVNQGAQLTVTDLKSERDLASSIETLSDIKTQITWKLDGHNEKDFLDNDIIVVNPDVPLHSPFLQLAIRNGKQIENELTLFYKFCPSKDSIAVTGTRGKTTTVNWIAHFLRRSGGNVLLAGNSPEAPLLNTVGKCDLETRVVIEEPSFLLEHLPNSGLASHVAVITNLYQDHLNRYKDMEHYAQIKANIFSNQKPEDYLILNRDNAWTDFFLKLKPRSKILFFSTIKLNAGQNGIYHNLSDDIIYRNGGQEVVVTNTKQFIDAWGQHNLENLLVSVLVAVISGVPTQKISEAVRTLPQVKFRQEQVFSRDNLKIYNDTSATSPDATIAGIERFAGPNRNLVLITGGTNRNLDFSKLSAVIKQYLPLENVIFLAGSATEIMQKELQWSDHTVFETLEECLVTAIKISKQFVGKTIILFSPASKSFEKFKNEFDRGEQFNKLVKKLL